MMNTTHRKKINIWFTDFFSGFDPEDNYFTMLLSQKYVLEINKNNPDYIIYSCYGDDFLNYNCIRIYYTGENLVPDFNLCDYAIGFHYINFEDRYLRFPNYALLRDQFDQLISKNKKFEHHKKEHFCNFIYSNANANPIRDKFFHLLNDYKEITSPGSHLNNIKLDIGGRFNKDWMYSKLAFQSKCKFSIAFENSSASGYTTEKIMHAFISNTIPIYWGNPKISEEFNDKAFINCHSFQSLEKVIERIKEIDNDDHLLSSILKEPAFLDNQIPKSLKEVTISSFLYTIIDQPLEKSAKRPNYGTTKKYEDNLKSDYRLKQKLRPFFKFLNR